MEHMKGKLVTDISSQCWYELRANGILICHTPADPQSLGYSPEEAESNAEHIKLCWNSHDELLAACKAIVRDYEAEDSKMVIDPASCVHVPNHTELCPYWLAKQALALTEGTKPPNG